MTHQNTPILLLHGLGGKPEPSFFGIKMFLKYQGYANIMLPRYPVDSYDSLEPCLDFIDEYLQSQGIEKNTEIIVIGQSMGGVYAHSLHKRGWNIKISVSIGSPVKGAQLLNMLEKRLPEFVVNTLTKPPYDLLKNFEIEKPPHPYHCITMGWFYWTDFDGVVFRNEAFLEEEYATHYNFSDHRFFNFNPRLFRKIIELISFEE